MPSLALETPQYLHPHALQTLPQHAYHAMAIRIRFNDSEA